MALFVTTAVIGALGIIKLANRSSAVPSSLPQAQPVVFSASEFAEEVRQNDSVTQMYRQIKASQTDSKGFEALYRQVTGSVDTDAADGMYKAIVEWGDAEKTLIHQGIKNAQPDDIATIRAASTKAGTLADKVFNVVPAGQEIDVGDAELPALVAEHLLINSNIEQANNLFAAGKADVVSAGILNGIEKERNITQGDETFEKIVAPAVGKETDAIRLETTALYTMLAVGSDDQAACDRLKTATVGFKDSTDQLNTLADSAMIVSTFGKKPNTAATSPGKSM